MLQTELLKLRRRSFLWLMLLSSLLMPFIALFYFRSSGKDIQAMEFFQWSAFSYTPWIILPMVLGLVATILAYEENQNDMLKQLWIVPVNPISYFLSKFFILLLYSFCFMIITAIASIVIGSLSSILRFDKDSITFLVVKCIEISVLVPFAMLPMLSLAVSQKGYIFPVCATIVYTFLGFILLLINMYLHPLSSATAIIIRNIPGITSKEPIRLMNACSCILLWSIASVLWASFSLHQRK